MLLNSKQSSNFLLRSLRWNQLLEFSGFFFIEIVSIGIILVGRKKKKTWRRRRDSWNVSMVFDRIVASQTQHVSLKWKHRLEFSGIDWELIRAQLCELHAHNRVLVACHGARYVSVSAIYAASVVVGRSRDKRRFMGPSAPLAPWQKGRTLFRGCERIPRLRIHPRGSTRRNRRGRDSWSREEATSRNIQTSTTL